MGVCHVSKIVQMVPNRAKQHISLHLESGVNSMSARVQSVIPWQKPNYQIQILFTYDML